MLLFIKNKTYSHRSNGRFGKKTLSFFKFPVTRLIFRIRKLIS